MLGWASEVDLDEVRAAVKKYTPEDLDDLESLIFIGKKAGNAAIWGGWKIG